MVNAESWVEMENLGLRAGRFRLAEISLSVPRGGYFILLGPTGCGKTLLAETLCGLHVPDEGTIRIGGRDVTRADPARRQIGYVPQDCALLPFKTVGENIAFGMRARRVGGEKIRQRLGAILETLDLGHLRDRHPGGLSGGERQRVALGRALAIKPELLVLDEPLSALDEETCHEMMKRLKSLHGHFQTTFVHICHRLEEALTLGTNLALMRQGRIEQIDTPGAMLARPRNLFVARFFRMPNLARGNIAKNGLHNWFHLGSLPVGPADLPEGPACGVIPLELLRLSIARPEEREGWFLLRETIEENHPGPHHPRVSLRLTGLTIPGIYPANGWTVGSEVFLQFPRDALHPLPAAEDSPEDMA